MRLISIENKNYIAYLDYIDSYINNENTLNMFIFDDKKVKKLKDKILKCRKLKKVSKYKLNNLAKDFEKAVVEKISKEEYLRRARKQKIKKINEYERNNN